MLTHLRDTCHSIALTGCCRTRAAGSYRLHYGAFMRHMSETESAFLPFATNSTQLHANLRSRNWAMSLLPPPSALARAELRPSSGGTNAPSLLCMRAIYQFHCALESPLPSDGRNVRGNAKDCGPQILVASVLASTRLRDSHVCVRAADLLRLCMLSPVDQTMA